MRNSAKSERLQSAYRETTLDRLFNTCVHPFLSGLFGSSASLVAKHTFSPDFGGWQKQISALTHNNKHAEFGIRVLLFLIMLYLNSLMLKFFINSLKRNGATLAKVLSLSISFFANGLISYFYFQEPIKPRWCIGFIMIMVGIYFLAKDKDNQDQESMDMAHKEGKALGDHPDEASTNSRSDCKSLEDEDYKLYGSFDKV